MSEEKIISVDVSISNWIDDYTNTNIGIISAADAGTLFSMLKSKAPDEHSCINHFDLSYIQSAHITGACKSCSSEKSKLHISAYTHNSKMLCIPDNILEFSPKLCVKNISDGNCKCSLFSDTIGKTFYPNLYQHTK